MNNALSRSFRFGTLLKFALPTMIMMVFMSLYTMVDGAFVSRFVGTSALSAVNIVYPFISVVIAVGIMLATGGSAVIAKKMGEGSPDEARRDFSFIIVTGICFGVVLAALGGIFLTPLLRFLGADDSLFGFCHDYAVPLLLFTPLCILAMLFQTLFVTAGKPGLGMTLTILGGITNIVLDYVFLVPAKMGIAGAAWATGIGYCVPAVTGLIYFALQRKGTLFFVKPRIDGKMLLKSCGNGASEMVTNLSTAVTTLLFNLLFMKYAGEEGVASITIVLYTQFLLTAIYLGYSTGTAPVFSYNYGSGNQEQLKRIFKISILFIGICSVATFAASYLFAGNIVMIFTDPQSEVFHMSVYGFHIFAVSFLFTGISIFASAMFTALSDGKVSAMISFLRTFVFLVGSLLLLPLLFGIDGIWMAVPAAEILAIIVSIFYFVRKRKKYGYA